ncbi:hypothetical protein B0O99DRAFT_327703 [Bisporella sp. PMI_857]|nr:hypothetical protein B0O99DRAFT_327703 [Bisporella sp. PMI_857]
MILCTLNTAKCGLAMPPDISDALESSPDVVINKTNDLLNGILAELQNIGRQLQQQDVRLGAVERQMGGGVKDGQGIVEVKSRQFRPTPLRALWRPVFADIESAGPNRHTIQNALHIYINDLVGIDQLDHEDRLFPDIPVRKATMEEERDWTQLVGNIWRIIGYQKMDV